MSCPHLQKYARFTVLKDAYLFFSQFDKSIKLYTKQETCMSLSPSVPLPPQFLF